MEDQELGLDLVKSKNGRKIIEFYRSLNRDDFSFDSKKLASFIEKSAETIKDLRFKEGMNQQKFMRHLSKELKNYFENLIGIFLARKDAEIIKNIEQMCLDVFCKIEDIEYEFSKTYMNTYLLVDKSPMRHLFESQKDINQFLDDIISGYRISENPSKNLFKLFTDKELTGKPARNKDVKIDSILLEGLVRTVYELLKKNTVRHSNNDIHAILEYSFEIDISERAMKYYLQIIKGKITKKTK